MIKKIFSSIITLAVGVSVIIDGYIMLFKNNSNNSTKSSISTSTSKNTTSSVDAISSKKTLKNGTYTGKSTRTEWGDVQILMTVSGGKITVINVIKHPTEGRSAQINENAIPIYKREALAVQSSQINQVSGATETFKGFTRSLQNAIIQAENSQ